MRIQHPRCPVCGVEVEGTPGEAVRPGYIAICLECAAIMEFDHRMELRPVGMKQLAALDDATRRQLQSAQRQVMADIVIRAPALRRAAARWKAAARHYRDVAHALARHGQAFADDLHAMRRRLKGVIARIEGMDGDAYTIASSILYDLEDILEGRDP